MAAYLQYITDIEYIVKVNITDSLLVRRFTHFEPTNQPLAKYIPKSANIHNV